MDDVKGIVQEKYGAAARRVTKGEENACCGASACCDNNDPITGDLYSAEQASEIPEEAVRASLGCGNPTALAELKAGETVLDLGSGGGRTSPRKDCLRRSSLRMSRTAFSESIDRAYELALARECGIGFVFVTSFTSITGLAESAS